MNHNSHIHSTIIRLTNYNLRIRSLITLERIRRSCISYKQTNIYKNGHKIPLYTPKDIFISFCGREATEAERWQGVQSGIIFHKRTGNEFLDLFASMVHHYMNHDPVFYAKKLGVSRVDLSGCLRVLTGVTTDEWLEAYRWVAIRDVLLHTDWPLGKVATKMGYSSVKTFSRAFIERVGMPPSHWRAKYKGND